MVRGMETITAQLPLESEQQLLVFQAGFRLEELTHTSGAD